MRRLKGSTRVLRLVIAGAIATGVLAAQPARAQHAFAVGPYLMDPRPRSMAVMFEPATACAATVTATTMDGRAAARVEQGPAAFHEVVLDGLSPATSYRYRVETSAGATASGTFTTPSEPGTATVRMVVYGDSRSDAAAHATIARAIAGESPDLVVHTGDMVEYGDDPAQWREALRTLGPAIRHAPLVPVLGNHELLGADGVGIGTWRKYVRAPAGGPPGETSFVVRDGPLVLIVIDVFADWSEGSPSRRWLERALGDARSATGVRQVMVAMHHGPLSSGYHGENEMLHDSGLDELWRRAGVSLLLSGHDHDYERGEARGLKYVVTGGGGAPLFPMNRAEPYELAWDSSHHYVVVEVSGDRVDVVAKRADGSVIDRCGFTGHGPWRCAGARDGRGPVESTSASAIALTGRWGKAAALAAAAVVGALLVARARRGRNRPRGGGP